MKRKIIIISVLAVATLGFVLTLSSQVDAWAIGRGYFTHRSISNALRRYVNCGSGPQGWHKVWCGGIANYAGNKTGFINAVLNKLNNGNGQEKLGASFIIYTMTGHSWGGSRRPSNAVIQDWKDRVNNPDITITNRSNFRAYPDTAYVVYAADGVSDVAFIPMTSDPDNVLVFKYKGKDVYYLKRGCANPIGDMPGLPDSAEWNLTGKTQVSKSTAGIGDTVTFTHNIKNVGSAKASNKAWKTSGQSGGNATGTIDSGTVTLDVGRASDVSTETYVIPSEYSPGVPVKVGDTICRHIRYPNSESSPSDVNSADACVTIVSDYDLYPKVTYGGGDLTPLVPGQTAKMTQQVTNTSLDSPRDSHYEIQQFVVPAGVAKPTWGTIFNSTQSGIRYTTADHANDRACNTWMVGTYGSSAIKNCSLIESGNKKFTAGDVTFGMSDINADDYSPGDWICRIVSVSLYNYSTPEGSLSHRISYPICVVIAKSPSVQILGDDLRVGNGFTSDLTYEKASVQTGKFTASGAIYGSWAEYGIFAPADQGTVRSVSGGVLAGTAGGPTSLTASDLNALTFANTGDPYGRWSSPRVIASIEDFAARFSSEQEHAASINVGSAATHTGNGEIKRVVLDHAGGVTLSGNYTNQNATTIFIYDGTVTIDGDITVADKTIESIGSASQIIIIANNIIVKNNVKNIDAWLVARATTLADAMGVISTCDEIKPDGNYTDGLSLTNPCNQNQLRINGAVVAKELQLRRTYGADKAIPNGLSVPAEIINLRADAYLWAHVVTASGAVGYPMETAATVELPPRF